MIATGIAALTVLAAGAAAVWHLRPLQPVAVTAATATATPPALPDKPSLAVLPFANLSGDPAQDYLGDGLTENLLDALAQNPGLFVIARGATLVYRGKRKTSACGMCWKAAFKSRATASGSRHS